MKKKIEKIHRGTCLCCPQTENNLQLETVLYNGFGGYHVERDGEIFYSGDSQGEWDSFKKLQDIENEAQKDPHRIWKVVLNNPLRGATWGRKETTGEWILLETNQGFA